MLRDFEVLRGRPGKRLASHAASKAKRARVCCLPLRVFVATRSSRPFSCNILGVVELLSLRPVGEEGDDVRPRVSQLRDILLCCCEVQGEVCWTVGRHSRLDAAVPLALASVTILSKMVARVHDPEAVNALASVAGVCLHEAWPGPSISIIWMHSSSEVVNTLAIGVDMLLVSGRDLGQALHVELPLPGQDAGLDADGLDPGGQESQPQSEPKPPELPELGQPKRRHPFTAVVHWLRLGNKLRNMEDTGQVLHAAAHILGGQCLELETQARLKDGRLVLPHRTTIQKWAVKLDLAVMAWRRHMLGKEGTCCRHCGADAFPQSGFNYLCSREETMRWGAESSISIAGKPLLGGFAFTSRSLPVATLGKGRGDVADKAQKLLRSLVLECGEGAQG